jgi:hypothetical protein
MLNAARERLKQVIGQLLFPSQQSPETICRKQDEWSVGIYIGQSPFEFASPEHVNNPILTRANVSDAQAALVADPFMLHVDQTWYMFFEVMNQQTGKGEIGLASSDNAVQWTYQQIILAEPFHLSYPYVFEWRGDYYMIPESCQARSIRLYKAERFPTHWALEATLLNSGVFLDPSIFRSRDRWWMFAETNPHHKYDTLRLYSADDLRGAWHEHEQSPIIEGNPHIARPAGRVVVLNDRIIRYAQDCYPVYGTQVRAFEVTELTRQRYSEHLVHEVPILAASGGGWNAYGMHHIDPHPLKDGRWIACVDGFVWRDVVR